MFAKFGQLALGRTSALRLLTGILGLAVVNGCTTTSLDLSKMGLSQLVHTADQTAPATEIVLADQRQVLGTENELESTIRNVLDLADQKRFSEASELLGHVRSTLARNSKGYQAVTASMALLALRSGDFERFERFAGQLDATLEDPLRVDPAFIEIVSLYRAVNGMSLPVNAPEPLRRLGLGVAERAIASR